MKPCIKFTKTWLDEDMVDLHVDISDGTSSFATQIYVGHRQLRDAIQGLQIFKDRIHGGIFNLRFGEFGAEYASGALDARFQFRKLGKILVRVSVQSAFQLFEEKGFASEAKLFLVSEPALLDAFVHALTAWRERGSEQAELEAIFWN